MTFEAICDRFAARRVGAEWQARCPTHEDRNPSLSIAERNGKILLHCWAGCATKDILATMGLTFADLNGSRNVSTPLPAPKIVATYPYLDEAGKPLYEVVRFDPKGFKHRRPDNNRGWIWNMAGVRRVPYNLPDVLREEHVVIVEGEKDADRGRRLGLTTTCNSGGAGKWPDEHSTCLRGKHVTIIPDNDEPGRKHAAQIARSLVGKAATIAICSLPEGVKDLSDWNLSRESLLELIKKAPAWKEPDGPTLEVIEKEQLVEEKLPEFPQLEAPLGIVCDALGPDLAYAHKALVALSIVGMKISGRSTLASDPFMQPRLYACLIGPPDTAKSSTASRMLAALERLMDGDIFCEKSIDSAAALVEALREHNRLILTPDELPMPSRKDMPVAS